MPHPEERHGPRGLGRALQVGDRLAEEASRGVVKPGKAWVVVGLDNFWGWVDIEKLG